MKYDQLFVKILVEIASELQLTLTKTPGRGGGYLLSKEGQPPVGVIKFVDRDGKLKILMSSQTVRRPEDLGNYAEDELMTKAKRILKARITEEIM